MNPRLIPVNLILRMPAIAKSQIALALFRACKGIMATHKPKARLRAVRYRGQESAAMIYDDLPIIDCFRLAPDGTIIGAMDIRGLDAPFMFELSRIDPN
ncbi:DUF4334 domain-containing protein [Xanthobacteraceae bacterium A53D]